MQIFVKVYIPNILDANVLMFNIFSYFDMNDILS